MCFFFICFQRIYNCLLNHFYDGCFKVLVRSFQHLIHLSVAIYWLSLSHRLWFPWFLVWWVILLLLYPEHFIRFQVLFNLFFFFFPTLAVVARGQVGVCAQLPPGVPAKIGHQNSALFLLNGDIRLSFPLCPTDTRVGGSWGLTHTSYCCRIEAELSFPIGLRWHQQRDRGKQSVN